MGIRFQCESRLFHAVFARTKVLLADQGQQLSGYEPGTGESVYLQMEAAYRALWENLSGLKDLSEVENLSETVKSCETVFFSGSKPGTDLNLMIYYSALLLEAGLHPVLVFGENRSAVGVWMYEDYNMGESRIRNSAFAEEAYDAGGMLLAVDCGCLAAGDGFSRAVEAGCQTVSEFIFAVDAALEDPEVLLADSAGKQEVMTDFDDHGNCSYFQELLHLYDAVPVKDSMAAGIMSREVRSHRFAEAFFRGPARLEQDEILFIRDKEDRQELTAADYLHLGMEQGETALLLAPEKILNRLQNIFARSGASDAAGKSFFSKMDSFADFLEFVDEHTSAEEICEKAVRFREATELPADQRMDVKKRRYQEIREKMDYYNRILQTETGCGMSLSALFAGWERVKEYEPAIVLPDERIWKTDVLEQVRQYADLLEKCRQKDQNGRVYLDFAELTQAQMQELIELLHACEKPAEILYAAVDRFGKTIGRPRRKNESARSYLQAVTECAEILEGCLELYELKSSPEYIPQARKLDVEEKLAYDAYCIRQQNLKFLEEFPHPLPLQELDGKEQEQMYAFCEEIRNELSNKSLIRSRAYRVAVKNVTRILENAGIPGWELKQLDSDSWKSLCAGILEYLGGRDPVLFSDEREQIFKEMTELFGEQVLSHDSYLFARQKMLVQKLQNLKKEDSISGQLADDLEKCLVSASDKTSGQGKIRPGMEKVYRDARSLLDNSDAYSDAIKNVFRFLKIDYHAFLQSCENESMMNFIIDWERLLEEEKVYDRYHGIKMTLLRNRLAGVLEQSAGMELTPEQMYRGFERAWYLHNRQYYIEETGFDLQDYAMNLTGMHKIEEQIRRNEEIQLINRLLRSAQAACRKFTEEMKTLEAAAAQEISGEQEKADVLKQLFEQSPDFLQQICPAMCMTPDIAFSLLENSNMMFDRIILCGSEEIPFYKILYLVTRGRSLIITADKNGICMPGSAAERAQQMGFQTVQV